jgi:hypothetical protein
MENNKLPTKLHNILIGLILGDGHIYKTSPTSNSRFEMSFGKDRKLFALWISDLFKDYSNTGIKKVIVKTVFTLVSNYRIKTRSLPIFNYYHDIFYEKNNETWKYKKIVPSNIQDLMNPIVLAYLIMSDGNFDKTRNRIRIYTNSYSKTEVERLALSIKSKLNIYVGVLHDRKDQWILTIGAKELDNLRTIVEPHFEPSMLYRLGY